MEEAEERVPKMPLARVRRIIRQDDDIAMVSSAAVFAIAAATEQFVKAYAEQAVVMARGNQRRRLQYSDFSQVVSGIDRYSFLVDVVPPTVKYKEVLSRTKKSTPANGNGSIQTYLQPAGNVSGDMTASEPMDLDPGSNEAKSGPNEIETADAEINEANEVEINNNDVEPDQVQKIQSMSGRMVVVLDDESDRDTDDEKVKTEGALEKYDV